VNISLGTNEEPANGVGHWLEVVDGVEETPSTRSRRSGNSMMRNGGVMTIDETTKLDPATTVLGLRAGEKVALDEGDFLQPPRPFFAALESRFLSD
jgi:hypothetical protein